MQLPSDFDANRVVGQGQLCCDPVVDHDANPSFSTALRPNPVVLPLSISLPLIPGQSLHTQLDTDDLPAVHGVALPSPSPRPLFGHPVVDVAPAVPSFPHPPISVVLECALLSAPPIPVPLAVSVLLSQPQWLSVAVR